MIYQDPLQPWCVICHLPNLQSLVLARFHHRSNAEDYLKASQQLQPTATYTLIFDPLAEDRPTGASRRAFSSMAS